MNESKNIIHETNSPSAANKSENATGKTDNLGAANKSGKITGTTHDKVMAGTTRSEPIVGTSQVKPDSKVSTAQDAQTTGTGEETATNSRWLEEREASAGDKLNTGAGVDVNAGAGHNLTAGAVTIPEGLPRGVGNLSDMLLGCTAKGQTLGNIGESSKDFTDRVRASASPRMSNGKDEVAAIPSGISKILQTKAGKVLPATCRLLPMPTSLLTPNTRPI
jgi:hypothetical protein